MADRALVTGGNRGIGKAIAAGLIAERLEVVIGARDPGAGRAAAGELGYGSVVLDLDVPEGFDAALAGAGRIDALANNAGVLWDRPRLECPEDCRRSMQVMVHAPYALIPAVLPGMAGRWHGRIVNVSSGWGSIDEGLGGPGAYGWPRWN